MTATDPRPALAAALAARLAPAAEALAEAYVEDMSAGRAALSHLRQMLAVLDWAGAHMPEPEPEPAGEPADDLDDRAAEPQPAGSDYDGSEDEYHYRSEVYVGSQKTPEFRAWYAEQERRFGPLVPDRDKYDGSEDEYCFGVRTYVGKLTTPEFRDWFARQERREAAIFAAREAAGLDGR